MCPALSLNTALSNFHSWGALSAHHSQKMEEPNSRKSLHLKCDSRSLSKLRSVLGFGICSNLMGERHKKKMQETEINQNPITRVGARDLHPNFSSTFVISAGRE